MSDTLEMEALAEILRGHPLGDKVVANLKALIRERDEARQMNTALIEERDAVAGKLAREIGNADALRAENERLQRERDEALAEVERLKAAEIAGREVLLPMKREQAQRFAKEVRAKALEEAAEAVRKQKAVFHSPEYAGGPIGAISESFACDKCEDAILALKEKP